MNRDVYLHPFSHLLFPSVFYWSFSTQLCGVLRAVSGDGFQPSSWCVAESSETLVTHKVTKIIVLKTHSGNWSILFQLFLLLLLLSIEWTPIVTFLSFFPSIFVLKMAVRVITCHSLYCAVQITSCGYWDLTAYYGRHFFKKKNPR